MDQFPMNPNAFLPLTQTFEPTDESAAAAIVREAAGSKTPVYPIGGATRLDYGALPERPGVGLSLAKLNRVIDYPAADMTITVEAGMTMAELARTLAARGQRLPIDVPHADRATVGGADGGQRHGAAMLRTWGASANTSWDSAPWTAGARLFRRRASGEKRRRIQPLPHPGRLAGHVGRRHPGDAAGSPRAARRRPWRPATSAILRRRSDCWRR